jgi:hypothetical protein
MLTVVLRHRQPSLRRQKCTALTGQAVNSSSAPPMAFSRFQVSRVQGAPVADADLLADLRRVASLASDNRVSQPFYSKHGLFDTTTVSRRFGTWNNAVAAAGLTFSNEVDLPDDRLFGNLLVLWQHYGRQPRRAELARAPSTVSQSPYRRRFRSWIEALNEFVAWANAAEESSSPLPASGGNAGPRTGRDPSLRLRFKVLLRDSFTCCACGASPALSRGVELQVDHVVAWSNGGETIDSNLRTLCSRCNLGKSNVL